MVLLHYKRGIDKRSIKIRRENSRSRRGDAKEKGSRKNTCLMNFLPLIYYIDPLLCTAM